MSQQALVVYISQCCARKGCSLYQIADRLGLDYGAIEEFLTCRRKPRAKLLRAIAKELDLGADYLLEILER